MFKLLDRKGSLVTTGVFSDENGTAVARIRNAGKSHPELLSCEFEPISADDAESSGRFVKKQDLGKQACSTLLNVGEYQLFVVDAPEVPPQELRAAVRWKIQDLIDFHIDEAVVDVFDAPPGGPAGTLEQMYVVVARNETIRKHIDALERFGVNLKTIDIPELAMRNLAARLPEDEFGLVTLHLGRHQCLITLTRQATLFLTRTVDFNYDDLKGSPQHAAELGNRLALEIQRSLDYYEQHFHKAAIQSIAIIPPSDPIDGLDGALQSALGLKTRSLALGDVVDSHREPDIESAATCTLAVGCALRVETKTL